MKKVIPNTILNKRIEDSAKRQFYEKEEIGNEVTGEFTGLEKVSGFD